MIIWKQFLQRYKFDKVTPNLELTIKIWNIFRMGKKVRIDLDYDMIINHRSGKLM